MENLSAFFSTIYDPIPQPVFYVQADMIAAANQSAVRHSLLPGQSVLPLLGAQPLPLHTLCADGAASLPVTIQGAPWNAAVQLWEDGFLFLCSPAPAAGGQSVSTLFSVVQSMNNPLSNILGSSNILFPLLEELENPEIGREMASMNRSVYQLLRVVFNLSGWQAMGSDTLKLNREKTELCDFFYAFCTSLETYCRLAGLKFRYSIPNRTVNGWIDRQNLQRALLNLAANAIKFTPQGGKLQFSAEVERGMVLIRLTDTGEGMDAETLSTVFDPSAHPDHSTDPRCGLGFGLPFARKIAALHDGSLILTSVPGQGTTVLLRLPLAQPEQNDPRLCSPSMSFDYAGGCHRTLLELSEVLPLEIFDSANIN